MSNTYHHCQTIILHFFGKVTLWISALQHLFYMLYISSKQIPPSLSAATLVISLSFFYLKPRSVHSLWLEWRDKCLSQSKENFSIFTCITHITTPCYVIHSILPAKAKQNKINQTKNPQSCACISFLLKHNFLPFHRISHHYCHTITIVIYHI